MSTGGGELLAPPEARKARLKELEVVIADGWQHAVAMGAALREIRDDGLYMEVGARTFAEYCKSRWSMDRSRGYQLINAARVADAVSTAVDAIPIPTEFVGRELATLLSDDEGEELISEAWTKVSEKYKGQRPPTARLVHKVLVEEGYRPKVGRSSPSGGGRLKTVILLGQFGEKLRPAENRLDVFLTNDIVGRRGIGDDTRKLAGEYADRLDAMAKRLREFAEGS